MRSLLTALLFIFSLPSMASVCYKPLTTYTCSNSGGTSCTKVAVIVMVPDNVTPISSCSYQMHNAAETAQIGINQTNITTLSNSVSSLNTVATNLTTRSTNLETRSTNLENRTTTLETAYNSMVTTVNNISATAAQSSASVSSLSSQLNQPFDLNTALLGTAFFFSTVLFFYGISKSAGAILSVIRRPLGRG